MIDKLNLSSEELLKLLDQNEKTEVEVSDNFGEFIKKLNLAPGSERVYKDFILMLFNRTYLNKTDSKTLSKKLYKAKGIILDKDNYLLNKNAFQLAQYLMGEPKQVDNIVLKTRRNFNNFLKNVGLKMGNDPVLNYFLYEMYKKTARKPLPKNEFFNNMDRLFKFESPYYLIDRNALSIIGTKLLQEQEYKVYEEKKKGKQKI